MLADIRRQLALVLTLLSLSAPIARAEAGFWDHVSATILKRQLYGSVEFATSETALGISFANVTRFSHRYELELSAPMPKSEIPNPLAFATASKIAQHVTLLGREPSLRAPLTPLAH